MNPDITNETMSESRRPGKILVVDDQQIMRQVVMAILGQAEHEVLLAVDGAQALTVAEAEQPELILLDYQLPDMAGSDVCQKLQKHAVLKHIPVVIITSEDSSEVAKSCLEQGAVDFVRKPFAPEELIARVANHLKSSRQEKTLRDWKREVSKDLKMAGALQQAIASAPPLVRPGLRMRAEYRPSADVGGDFLDVLPLPNGCIAFYMGDTAGHGIAASLVASLLKSELNNLFRSTPDAAPHLICNQLHANFRRQVEDPSVYASLIVGVGHPQTRRFNFLRCGHPAPCCMPLQDIDWLARGGSPIGFPFFGETPYRAEQEQALTLAPGTTMLLYTDGILEAQEAGSMEEFGALRLQEAFASMAEKDTLSEGLQTMFNDVEERGFDLHDDCSLLALQLIDPVSVMVHESLPVDLEMPEDGARLFGRAIGDAGYPQATIDRVELLLLEVLGNIVSHGKMRTDELVTLQLEQTQNGIRIYIADPGPSYLVGVPPLMPADPLAERGRGLAIIDHLADSIQRERISSQNVRLFGMRCQAEKTTQQDAIPHS